MTRKREKQERVAAGGTSTHSGRNEHVEQREDERPAAQHGQEGVEAVGGVDDLDRLSTSGNLHVVEQRHEEDQ